MTTKTAIINRALQNIGSRTTVTDAELLANSTNEAIQANLIYDNCRDDTSRMAPWDCCLTTEILSYITSVPGTPENTTSTLSAWAKGLPALPWNYEYQYPANCLKFLSVIPQQQLGWVGVPISPVTVGAPAVFNGPPVKFKIAIDQFLTVTGAAITSGGTGYAVNDIITLAFGSTSEVPIGAPGQLRVDTLSGSAVASVSLVNVLLSSDDVIQTGSYYRAPTNPQSQSSTSGVGSGAAFNLTLRTDKIDQRVVLTDQPSAIANYIKQVTNPNVFDTLFQSAFIDALAAQLAMALTGDKALANNLFQLSNNTITEARKADANEGLTVNDVTPDWIRTRGICWPTDAYGPYGSYYDWGPMWPSL